MASEPPEFANLMAADFSFNFYSNDNVDLKPFTQVIAFAIYEWNSHYTDSSIINI